MNKTNYMKIPNAYRTFLLLTLLWGATLGTVFGQQDIVMRGAVVLQNSKTLTGKVTYLTDVNIRSAKAIPTMSDSRGQFKLVFANVNYGSKTGISALKTGMRVVNDEVLKEAAIVGRADTLKVVMCDALQFEDNKQRFYSISTENLQRELTRRVTKLQRASAVEKRQLMDSMQTEMNVKLTSAEDAIAQLESRGKTLEAQLEKMSHDFALVNLDDESETYRLAYKAFTEGAVQKSLDILYAVDFKKRMEENSRQIKLRDSMVVTYKKLNDTSRTQISQDIQSCLLAANNHKILFQHREAQDWYETAIRHADTTNLNLLIDYTSYLYDLGDFAKAWTFNENTLRRARLLRQTADSVLYTEGYAFGLYYRALLLSRKATEPDSTIQTCFEALPLFEQLAQTDSLKRLELGRLMSELAQSYRYIKKDTVAIIWYNKALLAYNQSYRGQRSSILLLNKSFVYQGLGNTYRLLNKIDSSEVYSKLAVNYRRQLFQIDSFQYAQYLGLSLTMLANVYVSKKEYDIAIDTLQKAVFYHALALRVNPLNGQREMMRSRLLLADVYFRKRDLNKAEITLDSIYVILNRELKTQSEIWYLDSKQAFVDSKCLLIREYIKQTDILIALQKSRELFQRFPEVKDVRIIFAITQIFNNQYDKAILLLQPIAENKKEIKAVLTFFKNKNIDHPDFERLKLYFNL